MNKVKTYYTNDYDEEIRLKRSQANSIEFTTTLKFLLKHLPKNCSVLDCCAGTGIYAFPLAENGYKVTAGDLTEKHVEIIKSADKQNLLKELYQGDCLDMSRFADESFDAVICMGALYHLMDKKDREKCVKECLRVLKKDGILALAYLNRSGTYISSLYREHPLDVLDDVIKTGMYGIFYSMDFNEINELTEKSSLEKITDVGVDGLVYPLFDKINNLTEAEFDLYMNYHFATCEEPSIIGHSCHGLWIGKKI